MAVVRCNTICWNSEKCIKYHPGDTDDIDPLSPISKYFDFPEGTEVYHKIRGKSPDRQGNGGTPNIITTRIVGGDKPKEKVKKAPVVQDDLTYMCGVCKDYTGTKSQVGAHQYHCAKKHAQQVEIAPEAA